MFIYNYAAPLGEAGKLCFLTFAEFRAEYKNGIELQSKIITVNVS